MSIIEKLGITPFDISDLKLTGNEKAFGMDYRILEMIQIIKNHEQQRNETIETIISDILKIEKQTPCYYEELCSNLIGYLKILTGKPWEEIKELLK